jgi:PleD family two-component response regulator
MRQSGEPLKEWLRRADAALYRAKHAGRNRVSRADDLPDLGDAPSLAD